MQFNLIDLLMWPEANVRVWRDSELYVEPVTATSTATSDSTVPRRHHKCDSTVRDIKWRSQVYEIIYHTIEIRAHIFEIATHNSELLFQILEIIAHTIDR